MSAIKLAATIALFTKTLTDTSEKPGETWLQRVRCMAEYNTARALVYAELEGAFPALHDGNELQRQAIQSIKNLLFDHDVAFANRETGALYIINEASSLAKRGYQELSEVMLKSVPGVIHAELCWYHAHLVAIERHLRINAVVLANSKSMRDTTFA